MSGIATERQAYSGGLIQNEQRKRKFYVLCVVFLAVFLVSMLLWPLSVSQFKQTTFCSVSPSDQAASFESSEEAIFQVIRKITSDESLKLATVQLFGESDIQNELLKNQDWESLRETIKLSVQPSPGNESVAVQLSIIGNGNEDERRLLNHLASNFAVEFVRSNQDSGKDGFVSDIRRQLMASSHLETEDQLNELNNLRNAVDVTQTYLTSIVDELSETASAPVSVHQSASHQLVENPTWTALNEQRIKLIRQRESLEERFNWTIEKPQIATLQEQIDATSRLQNNTERFVPAMDSAAVVKSSEAVDVRKTNQYAFPAGHTTNQVNFDQVAQKLESVDLESTRQSIERLSTLIRNGAQERQKLFNSMQLANVNKIHTASSGLKINSLRLAESSSAIGAYPGFWQIILMAGCSLGIATVVTWKFEPNLAAKVFGSKERMEGLLKLPLLATITTRPSQSVTKQPLWHIGSIWIIRISEAILLILTVSLIAACLIDREFLPHFVENPMNAVAKVLSMTLPG
jgi:hypothetical protein